MSLIETFTQQKQRAKVLRSKVGSLLHQSGEAMMLPEISHLSLPQAYSYVPPLDQGLSNTQEPRSRRHRPRELFSKPSIPRKTGGSTLMKLPLEIRQHILTYVLPHTIGIAEATKRNPQVIWIPGCTAILATSRQLHDEGAKLMYGNAEFLVQVSYSGIKFLLYRKLSGSGLTPKQTPDFKRQVRERYRSLIRRVRVIVVVEDTYTAEIKYGWGGRGLLAGISEQTRVLVDMLNRAAILQSLSVSLQCDRFVGPPPKEDQHVLKPFLALRNVKQSTWDGPIESTFVEQLSGDTACLDRN